MVSLIDPQPHGGVRAHEGSSDPEKVLTRLSGLRDDSGHPEAAGLEGEVPSLICKESRAPLCNTCKHTLLPSLWSGTGLQKCCVYTEHRANV